MGGWMGSCRMPVPIGSSRTPVVCGCRSRDGIWQLASVLVPYVWWDELGSAQPPDPFQNPPAGPMPPPPAVPAQARMCQALVLVLPVPLQRWQVKLELLGQSVVDSARQLFLPQIHVC